MLSDVFWNDLQDTTKKRMIECLMITLLGVFPCDAEPWLKTNIRSSKKVSWCLENILEMTLFQTTCGLIVIRCVQRSPEYNCEARWQQLICQLCPEWYIYLNTSIRMPALTLIDTLKFDKHFSDIHTNIKYLDKPTYNKLLPNVRRKSVISWIISNSYSSTSIPVNLSNHKGGHHRDITIWEKS